MAARFSREMIDHMEPSMGREYAAIELAIDDLTERISGLRKCGGFRPMMALEADEMRIALVGLSLAISKAEED